MKASTSFVFPNLSSARPATAMSGCGFTQAVLLAHTQKLCNEVPEGYNCKNCKRNIADHSDGTPVADRVATLEAEVRKALSKQPGTESMHRMAGYTQLFLLQERVARFTKSMTNKNGELNTSKVEEAHVGAGSTTATRFLEGADMHPLALVLQQYMFCPEGENKDRDTLRQLQIRQAYAHGKIDEVGALHQLFCLEDQGQGKAESEVLRTEGRVLQPIVPFVHNPNNDTEITKLNRRAEEFTANASFETAKGGGARCSSRLTPRALPATNPFSLGGGRSESFPPRRTDENGMVTYGGGAMPVFTNDQGSYVDTADLETYLETMKNNVAAEFARVRNEVTAQKAQLEALASRPNTPESSVGPADLKTLAKKLRKTIRKVAEKMDEELDWLRRTFAAVRAKRAPYDVHVPPPEESRVRKTGTLAKAAGFAYDSDDDVD